MNRTLLISALFIALVAILGTVWLFFRTPAKGPETNNTPQFPSGSVSDDIEPSATAPIYITFSDGTSVAVPDFIPEEQPEWRGEGEPYVIAGGGELNGPGYELSYSAGSSTFSILLIDEPIGEKRRIAEQVLRTRLGLSDEDLCRLKTAVYVFTETAPMYAGQNLGLSFCPGSVPLP